MIFGILIFIHILVCISLILVILMQASKGKGLAGAFGGAAMATGVLGARGTATFLSKATTYLAVAFMVNALLLSILSRGIGTSSSAVQDALQNAPTPAQNLPAIPGTLEQPTGGVEPMPVKSDESPGGSGGG